MKKEPEVRSRINTHLFYVVRPTCRLDSSALDLSGLLAHNVGRDLRQGEELFNWDKGTRAWQQKYWPWMTKSMCC